jgi:hypothetical protein
MERILLLQVAGVRQQQGAQLARRLRGMDRAAEALARQGRQVAAVVDVRMREHHRIDLACGERERLPVAQAQLLQALEQAAVHQHPVALVLEEVFGSGDGAGGAKEGEPHGSHSSRAPRGPTDLDQARPCIRPAMKNAVQCFHWTAFEMVVELAGIERYGGVHMLPTRLRCDFAAVPLSVPRS